MKPSAMADADDRAEIYKRAFAWWRKWPEYVPNPDFRDRILKDVRRANELFEAEANAPDPSQGARHD